LTPLSFALASATLLLLPGPTNTLLAAGGATAGFRKAARLPVAEAMGYAFAISVFAAAASTLQSIPSALSAVKLAAAAWLLLSAWKLWTGRNSDGAGSVGFGRVLGTTVLNPKAMLVGTTMVPATGLPDATAWIAGYVSLSVTAGMAWVAFGSMLPAGVRRRATGIAAVVLVGFSALAARAALTS
jgi:threonine/homoserine/homoserine lactone efflux protein